MLNLAQPTISSVPGRTQPQQRLTRCCIAVLDC